MQAETPDPSGFAPPPWHAAVRSARTRLPGMLVAWGAIGAAVGVLTAPVPGPVGIVAGVIAGLIVMVPMGVMLTLAGGRARESLLGGVLGVTLVPAVVRLGDLSVTSVSVVPFGLIL